MSLYHINFFQYLDLFLIRTYKINCFLFRQHCDYLIVSVSIEFIYKIVRINVHRFFCEKSQKKMFFKRLQNRNKGQTNKKNNNCKLNANTEGISMTNIYLGTL